MAADPATPVFAEVADIPRPWLEDLAAAVAGLPECVHAAFRGTPIALFAARGLGCSAVTDVVRYADEVLGIVITLDLGNSGWQSANAWATWKENQPFWPDPASALRVSIEAAAQDDRSSMLQFLMLHELGHVLTAGRGMLPDWWTDPADLLGPGAYPFLDLSWRVSESRQIVPKAGHEVLGQDLLVYYARPRLTHSDIPNLLAGLSQSAFATLYGATNAYDDFAECFALFVHCEMMGRPFKIELADANGVSLLSDGSMVARRCGAKYRLISRLLRTDWASPLVS